MVALTVLAVAVTYGATEISALKAQNDGLSRALTATRSQVSGLGQQPVAPPPQVIIKDPSASIGPRGEPGTAGVPGRGVAALVCIGGEWTVTYTDGTTDRSAGICTGRTGATGRPGTAGTPGAVGTPGMDGKDGADGAPGPAGPAGPAGADGKDGTDGTDGKDGAPPASWTWTAPDGTAYTCTRDSGSPDDAPTYTCSALAAPPSASVRR